MSEHAASAFFLLGSFAEFYAAVADIKLAIEEGRLPQFLRVGDAPAPTESSAIAAMLSGQLAGVLRTQAVRVARECSPATARAHRVAAYAMAALADEVFVLELDWTGRDAWLDVLLEYKLFKSRTAGRQVFALTRQLLDLTAHSELHVDLAAVLLMTLQLGFKGQYRGEHGEAPLRELRTRLFARLRHGDAPAHMHQAFPQAYQNLAGDSAPSRLAPLTPWYIAGGAVLLIYLIVSTAAWLRLTQPFLDAVAGG